MLEQLDQEKLWTETNYIENFYKEHKTVLLTELLNNDFLQDIKKNYHNTLYIKSSHFYQFLTIKDFVVELFKKDPVTYQILFVYFPVNLRKDLELIDYAFENNNINSNIRTKRINFDSLSSKHKNNFEFIKKLIIKDPLLFQIIPTKFRTYPDILKLAFSTTKLASENYYYFPSKILNKELIKEIFIDKRIIYKLDKSLLEDVDFMEELFFKTPYPFNAFPSRELITKKTVLFSLEQGNVDSFEYLPVKYRNDATIMLEAIKINPSLMSYIGQTLAKNTPLLTSFYIENFNKFSNTNLLPERLKTLSFFTPILKAKLQVPDVSLKLYENICYMILNKKSDLDTVLEIMSIFKDTPEEKILFRKILEYKHVSQEIRTLFEKSSFESIQFSLKLKDKNKELMKKVDKKVDISSVFKRKF